MRRLLPFLLLLAAINGDAQPAKHVELSPIEVIPAAPEQYAWKRMALIRGRTLFNNAVACSGDAVYSFGGFNMLRVQREMNRLAGKKLIQDSLEYPGAGFMSNLFFIRDSLMYIGGGHDSGASRYSYTDFWRYNRHSRSWTRLHDLPFLYHHPPTMFAEDGRIIVLVASLKGAKLQDAAPTFYEYFPDSDRWEAISEELPVSWLAHTDAGGSSFGLFLCAFKIADDIFVFFQVWETGTNSFFKFSLADNQWTELPPFPGNTHKLMGAFAFSDGMYGYIGGGFGRLEGNSREVFRYDPEWRTWEQIKDLPLGLRMAKAWRFKGESYVGFGINDKGQTVGIWQLRRK
jgi:hypothetical protein